MKEVHGWYRVGREMVSKRQRLMVPNSAFYGRPMPSNFMYNASAYSYEDQLPPFPVVRLRGLPFDCNEADVAEFLHGLEIVVVLFVHKDGRICGDAFCVLGLALGSPCPFCSSTKHAKRGTKIY